MMSWRFWRFWSRKDLLDAGERARREHEEWLTRAISSGKSYPKIPLKPAATGGYSELMERPGGEQLAAAWWEAAFGRVDRLDEQSNRRV